MNRFAPIRTKWEKNKQRNSTVKALKINTKKKCDPFYRMVHAWEPFFFLADFLSLGDGVLLDCLFFKIDKLSLCLNLALPGDANGDCWVWCLAMDGGVALKVRGELDELGFGELDRLDLALLVLDLIDFAIDPASEWFVGTNSWFSCLWFSSVDFSMFATSSSSQLARYISIRYVPIIALRPPFSRCSITIDSLMPSSSNLAKTFTSIWVFCHHNISVT